MKNLKGKRVVLYRRVSTTDQKEQGNSLNTQRDHLRSFVEKNEMVILNEYQEDYSAKNFERPEFNRLRDFVRLNKGKVDYILITSWDRFSRNTYESLGVIIEMRKWGVEINSIENWIDHDDPQQQIMKLLYLGMPEVDNQIRSNKTREGMRQGLLEGRVNKAPVGYMRGRDPNNSNKHLIQIDDIKGPLMRDLFEEYALGVTSQSELMKKRKYAPLNLRMNNLSTQLKNVVYSGRVFVKAYKEETDQIVDGLHEALISIETFNKVQRVIHRNKKHSHKQNKTNEKLPLRGHLSCPKCSLGLTGSGSTSRSGKRHYYYHCQNSKGCDFRVKTGDLHEALNELFKELKVSDEIITLFKLVLQDKYEKTEKSNKQQLKKLRIELKKIEDKKETLLEKMLEGVISNEDYQKHNNKYSEQIAEIESGIDNLKADDKELKEYISFGTFMLQNLSEVYSKLDVNGKGKLIGSIFDEKLVFLKNKYRTPKLKDGAAFIFNNNKALQRLKTKKGDSREKVSSLVPEAGIEPAHPKVQDFESSASTSSATRANCIRRTKIGIF